uniref:Uncharacterized protein n=1 Tax=Manihot esculenta TaxID=3983 RepID=A0A2C9W733_MANES
MVVKSYIYIKLLTIHFISIFFFLLLLAFHNSTVSATL